MSKVRIEILSWLVETLDIEGTNHEGILEREIEEDNTVRYLLNQLACRYDRFGKFVFDVKAQKLNNNVSIFLNGRPVVLVNGLETGLKDGDVLSFVPIVEGG